MSIAGDPRLTKTNFAGLMQRLGVEGIATFDLIPHVLPVAIIDGATSPVPGQPLDVPFTAGEVVAPAANTRLADTGPLAAGQYNLTIWYGMSDTNGIRLRRRNGADNADIWSFRMQSNIPGANFGPYTVRVICAANERFVIENSIVGGGGVIYQGAIWVQGPF